MNMNYVLHGLLNIALATQCIKISQVIKQLESAYLTTKEKKMNQAQNLQDIYYIVIMDILKIGRSKRYSKKN